ncbi:hypothetical protein [Ruicaihuangia caeni]|uniref:hypothetical protein n=1 Tax=Ruicaihuangia caeni TaxID=3042517 RepID=UPI00338E17B7
MRKYLLSTSVLSAMFSGWGTIQQTRKGPRDWRLALHWIVWVCTLAIAIGTVAKNSDEIKRRLGA